MILIELHLYINTLIFLKNIFILVLYYEERIHLITNCIILKIKKISNCFGKNYILNITFLKEN